MENIINRYSDWETGLSPNELIYGSLSRSGSLPLMVGPPGSVQQFDGDSELIDPSTDYRFSSLKYARNPRSSPVIRRDSWLLGNKGEKVSVDMSLLDTGSITFSFISPMLAESVQHLFPIQMLDDESS